MNGIVSNVSEFIHRIALTGHLAPVVFLCSVVFLLLLWLLLRGLRLWYWKVDLQMNVLKNIDLKLQEIGQEFKESKIDQPLVPPVEMKEEEAGGTQENVETGEKFYSKKTGKLYTEVDLEVLIKD